GWPLGTSLALLLVWEVLVRALGVRAILLPPPSAIIVVIFTRYDLLLANLWPSLYMTVFGFLLSVVGGVAIAILITYSAIARKALYPIIVVSQVVPKISIAPLLIVWFGTGAISGLLLAFLIGFFPMTINAAAGFQAVDEDIISMARACMGSRWQIFRAIRLPHAMPYLFSGMKISITLAIIGVIVSEFVASQEGIGYLIKLAGGLLDTPLMLAAITVLSLTGLLLYAIIAWLEGRVIYWQSPSFVEVGPGA
ncbi:MAG TPA: ABC transporter permease, partial [Alphaproteobacteria bacterium]|nr:ABC transporter permease [Alphaproteobacteria bacterium]